VQDTISKKKNKTLFTIAKLRNQARCPSRDGRIKKMWHIYTMEYYSARRNEIMLFTGRWMELEIIMLGEISQTEKDRY
jgi:hypothetical protein